MPGDRNETARVEAFSDGVFAIAMTLLILEIRVPHEAGEALGRALLERWPSFVAFVTSFATIGIMWLNALLLLGVTFVPFPTAVIAEYLGHAGEKQAAQFYSGTFLVIAVLFNLLWRYAASPRRRPSLLEIATDDPAVRAVHGQYWFGPVVYSVALGLAFYYARASLVTNLGLALFFAFPPRPTTP